MKTKVELTITRTKGVRGQVKKTVEVIADKSNTATMDQAKLQWANEYINRDCRIKHFTQWNIAKDFLQEIEIKARII